MTEKEKMLAGELYSPIDPQLREEYCRSLKLCREFNDLDPLDFEGMKALFKQIANVRGDALVMQPIHIDYGSHLYVGENFYANYGFIALDVCEIKIGDNVMFGPNVQLLAATHPADPQIRISGLECGKPITIGDNVWLGGGVIVCPGVTIGKNAVVGAGAVVTKDIPDNVIAGGNPCRVIKKI